MKKMFLNKVIIFAIALLISIPLLLKNFFVYIDDGYQHIARAYSMYLSIINSENITISSNLANGFGYSWNLFYGLLSPIVMIIIKIFTNSFINAYKIEVFLGLFLSGITMYNFVFKISNKKDIGLYAAIFYMSMPYHLTDMLLRSALGEFLSYIFIPLLFLGIYKVLHNEKGIIEITLSASLLILTHNLMSIIAAIFCCVYLITNIKYMKNKSILKQFIISFFAILCLTAFYWIPLMQTRFSTEYAVYQENVMSTPESLIENALNPILLITTNPNSELTFELGLPVLILLITCKKVYGSIEKNVKKEYLFFLITGIFTAIMATSIFPWKMFANMFQIIQFPWRLLVISNFCLSIVCAFILSNVLNKSYKYIKIIIIILIIILMLKSINIYVTEDIKDINNTENVGIITLDKEKCGIGVAKGEYLPIKAYNNREYLFNRGEYIYVIKGNGKIIDLDKNGNKLSVSIENLNKESVYELPYIYYPGYTILVNGKKVNGFESEHGMLSICLDDIKRYEIKVEYTGTIVMKISYIISLISLIIYIIYIIIYIMNCNKKNNENKI